VEFVSVVDAVRWAVDIQRGMSERNTEVPADKRIEFCIGINVGDIIFDGDDIFGDSVNVVAGLEALADPGGIMVSGVARDQVRDKHLAASKALAGRDSEAQAVITCVSSPPQCGYPLQKNGYHFVDLTTSQD
jgi:class 3 adenylate cyclase